MQRYLECVYGKGATFTENDIPLCPTTATELPHAVITWEEAKSIYKKHRIPILRTMRMFVGILMITSSMVLEAFGMTTISQ